MASTAEQRLLCGKGDRRQNICGRVRETEGGRDRGRERQMERGSESEIVEGKDTKRKTQRERGR